MRSLWLQVYRLLVSAAAPFAARRLARAAGDDEIWLAREPERLGQVPKAGGELWLHAASVGEVNAAEGLIRQWLAREPALRLVVTTLTRTAAAEVAARFVDQPRLRHLFAPLDAPGHVGRWLDRTDPRALVLIETEIWPVMLDECARRGLPVAIVNGRISARAFGRYRRFAGLFAEALRAVEPVLCQSDADRQRFRALGVAPDRLHVTGNLKLDRLAPKPPDAFMRAWRKAWQSRPVWIAGSTHEGEEALLARAHLRLLETRPDALMVMVPRHPERAGQALATLQRTGLGADIARYDAADGAHAASAATQALVVDRMGVLAGLYALADLAFVGGSLVDGIGGHNLIEPAMVGKPVLTGRFTADQADAADALERGGGLIRIDAWQELTGHLAMLLADSEHARRLGDAARRSAAMQSGALEQTLQILSAWPDKTNDNGSRPTPL